MNNTEDDLVSFYLGQSTDDSGRTIYEIHSWNYEQLERVHDYIQWLFPSNRRSQFNWSAPILDNQQITTFRNSDELKSTLLKSFKLMLSFYGFQCVDTDENIRISKSSEFAKRKIVWLNYGNHNYLRITRILKSLLILGLERYAQEFFYCLQELYYEEEKLIGEKTFNFWQQVVRQYTK
jgi:hypothetical protein